MNEGLIVAGYAEDIERVVGALGRIPKRLIRLHNETVELPELGTGGVVAYVFSQDTGYSSQLLSIFTWVHHNAAPAREYVIDLTQGTIERTVFDFAKPIPRLSIDEFRQIVEGL